MIRNIKKFFMMTCPISTSVFSVVVNHPAVTAFGAAGGVFTLKSFLLAPGGLGKPRCPVERKQS